MTEIVTLDNFARAETAHYFVEQSKKAPVNRYFHNRVAVNIENQVIIRSNVDLIYSYAVVDLTESATFSVPSSDQYQVAQLIDENHYVVDVVYPGETKTVTHGQLTTGSHLYVLARTATSAGVDRAHELQDRLGITSETANHYVAVDYDEPSRQAVGASLEARSAEADFSKGFGTPESTDPFQHTLAARLGWGGLPPQHAQYFQALATSTGWDTWTFELPPLDFDHNGYFSVIKYDDMGWIDVAEPCLPDHQIERNPDGTISICFGDDRCADQPNRIETTEGQRFYYGIRLYRPIDASETVTYIDSLRATPLTPASH